MALKIDNAKNILVLTETTSPGTPEAGTLAIYADASGSLRIVDDAGADSQLLSSGSPIISGATALSELSDVALGSPLSTDEVLTYNGTSWVNQIAEGGTSVFTESGTNLYGGTNTTAGGGHNFVAGYNAGAQMTGGGTHNVFIGSNAGRGTSNSDKHVFIGAYAGGTVGNITGSWHTVIGYRAGEDITSNGYGSVIIGAYAGRQCTTEKDSVIIGLKAGNQTGAQASANNVIIGGSAGGALGSNANSNVIVGRSAGAAISSGDSNVIVGFSAGPTTNTDNQLFINNSQSDTPLIHGDFSTNDVTINGSLTITGGITVQGSPALPSGGGGIVQESGTSVYGGTNTVEGGYSNVSLGYNAGANLTASCNENVCIGRDAGASLYFGDRHVFIGAKANGSVGSITGHGSVAIGFKAGYELNGATIGTICIGEYAGQAITTGSNSIFIGYKSGRQSSTQSGTGNVVIGGNAGNTMSTGGTNVIVGHNAGQSITSGSNNICIGTNAGPTTSVQQKLYIDITETDTPLIYGDFATDSVTINDNLTVTNLTVTGTATGVGGSAPQHEKLIIAGSPISNILTTTVTLTETAGSPIETAYVQVFRNGMLMDEDLIGGSPLDITEDYVVLDTNTIIFADGILEVNDKIKIYVFG